MKKGLVEVVCIIDRSGSMQTIMHDTIGGFNTFLNDCKNAKDEDRRVTVVLFDTDYKILHNGVPAKDVPDLSTLTFVPRGGTALYDALGRAINEVGERLSNTAECDRPETVMFCIVTDGEENASREFNADMIKEKINHQMTKYAWSFVYLGANQDAVLAAGKMGIAKGNTLNYACNTASVTRSFSKMSDGLSYRARNAAMYMSRGVDEAPLQDIMAMVNNGSTEA